MNQTKMEVKKSIDSEVYTYCSIEDALSECHRVTNKKTGVTVSLDSDQKLMYMRMRKRFHLFTSMGNSFYDNVDVLADACGVNLRTFQRKMPGLIEAGLIDKNDSLKSNSYTVADLTPDNFLLERKDKKLGWVDCLEYPVFGSKRPQEAPKAEVQETEAVTETSPQEPQQPETNPALPSSDDIHTSADSGSDDSQDEQQTESPPDTSTEKIKKPATVYPWGSSGAFNPNRSVTEPAKQWALSKTGGNVYQAERYLMNYLSQLYAKPVTLSFHEEEESEELPF